MQYRRLLLACGGYFLLGGYLFMNLYHLRYFVTLAHMEHYTRAADLLAITQPSLSHAISSLESELGVKLFKKNGRNVTLTKYGKSFLTDAEDILQKLDSSVGNLQLAGKGEGRIDIGERFKFCVNRKTDIRYVISYRGQNLFFRVLSLFVL